MQELNEVGKQKPVDKTIRPLTTLSSVTPADVTGGVNLSQLGSLPIGNYKGIPAFWDLDKAVNQPLVLAEQQHILGVLDGREEDYDLQTVGVVLAEAIGTAHVAALIVPAGQVWYINSVLMTHAGTGGASAVTGNWYCSLWTDRLGALGYGQAYHAAAVNPGAGAAMAQVDDFWCTAPVLGVANKAVMLRAPAGTTFTVVFTTQLAVAALAINCTLQLMGYIGKTLVA